MLGSSSAPTDAGVFVFRVRSGQEKEVRGWGRKQEDRAESESKTIYTGVTWNGSLQDAY